MRHQSHAAVRAAALTAHSLGDTSFTWSKGPCSSIVTTSSVKAGEGGALGGGSRLGKPGNRRNQHRHLVVADEARLDAHSDSRKRGSGNASEKEGGCGLRPFEDHESSGRSARTSEMQLQKSSEATSGLE